MVASAAFFDLDKTIIAKSSLLAFGRPLYREGLLSRRAIVRNAYAQVVFMLVGADEDRMEKLRVVMLELIRGWNREHVAEIVRETLDEVITPIIFAEALEIIAEHQSLGRRVVIVSSAPEEVVRPLGEFLGVDDVIATRAAVDDDGRYTGELAYYGYGPYKAEGMRALAARDGLDLSESYAYSDSCTDEPMLRAVGHPFAVNPDRELARVAGERKGGRFSRSRDPFGYGIKCRTRHLVRRCSSPAHSPRGRSWRGGGSARRAGRATTPDTVNASGPSHVERETGPGVVRTSGSGFAEPSGHRDAECHQDEEEDQLLHRTSPAAGCGSGAAYRTWPDERTRAAPRDPAPAVARCSRSRSSAAAGRGCGSR